jgi:hypothetical protein
MLRFGWPEQPEDAEVRDTLDLGHLRPDLNCERFQYLKVWSDNLDRIGAFDARQCFFNVVLDILREIEPDARQFLAELLLQLFRERLFGDVGGPFVERFQRRE